MLGYLRRSLARRPVPPPAVALAPCHPLFHYNCEFDAPAIMRAAVPETVEPTPGVVTNFLGVMTDPRVMASILTPMAGTVEGFPWPGNWHADIAEWASALLAVSEAKETFRIIELGCGWGCWLNNTGVVARRRNLAVRLVGIEGDPSHLANAELTLKLNGFTPSQYRLVHGIAAPQSGKAFFPQPDPSGEAWGGEAVFNADTATAQRLRDSGRYQELDSYTLADLSEGEAVDLLHIDIQGAEVDFVTANFSLIAQCCRNVLIGTHSRAIDGALMAHFLGHGWQLKMERPALFELVDSRPEIRIDGVQMWRNPGIGKG